MRGYFLFHRFFPTPSALQEFCSGITLNFFVAFIPCRLFSSLFSMHDFKFNLLTAHRLKSSQVGFTVCFNQWLGFDV